MVLSVVITGASTGIGAATVRLALSTGARVFGSVRNPNDARALQSAFGTRFTPLLFDVRDEPAIQAAAATVRAALDGRRLGGLVNNAGVALPGPLALQPLAEFRDQLDVNLTGPLAVIQAFLPLLGTDPSLAGPPGRIVNISSIGGSIAAPFLGAYSAAKHALEGLSDSLRRELMLFGIDVIVVAPGSVATPIWDKAEDIPVEPLLATPYGSALQQFRAYALKAGRAGLAPEAVAETIWRVLGMRHPPARVTIVKGRLANWTLPRLLPTRRLDRIIAGQLGLRPGS